MLVLTRKINQKLIIDNTIEVSVLGVQGNVVKLGVKAPLDVQVYREEIYREIQKTNREARTQETKDVDAIAPQVANKGFDIISKLKK